MSSLLFQTFASANVEDSEREKQRGRCNENNVQHDSFSFPVLGCLHPFCHRLSLLQEQLIQNRNAGSPRSELDHDGHVDKGLIFAKIREPDTAESASASRFRSPKARLS